MKETEIEMNNIIEKKEQIEKEDLNEIGNKKEMKKRILIRSVICCCILIAILFVLFLWVLINGILFVTPQENINFSSNLINTKEKVTLVVNKTKALIDFRALIGFRTDEHYETNPTPFNDLLSYINSSYPNFYGLEKLNFPNAILFKWEGTQPTQPPIVFQGHIDVVEADANKWDFDPWAGVKDGEYIYGRGTLDMKGIVLSYIYSTEELIKEGFQPNRTIYFSISFNEERSYYIPHYGVKEVVEHLKNNVLKQNEKIAMLLDEGGFIYDGFKKYGAERIALVGIQQKGNNVVELQLNCEPGHSSAPPIEGTCIEQFAEKISKIKNSKFNTYADYEPIQAFLTYVFPNADILYKYIFGTLRSFYPLVGDIFSGAKETQAFIRSTVTNTIIETTNNINNKLPSNVKSTYNVRLYPTESMEYIINEMLTILDDERFNVTFSTKNEPQGFACYKCKEFEIISQTFKSHYKDNIVSPYLYVAGSDSFYFQDISDNSYNLSPIFFSSELEDVARIHGYNERIVEEDLYEGIKFYYSLIKNLNEL